MIRFSAHVVHEESTAGETKEIYSPMVASIATHPGSTTLERAQRASPKIMNIFERHGISGVVMEWYEGCLVRL